MLNFNAIIQNEYESVYGNAYDLSLRKLFSKPKIYTAKGDLTKRWYVYFSYRDPDSGKLVRQTPFYGNANTYKTKDERIAVLAIYQNIINKYLNAGLSPYGENSEKLEGEESRNEIETLKNPRLEPGLETETRKEDLEGRITINDAFNSVLEIKVRSLRESSLRSFKSHVKIFLEWLASEHNNLKYITEIDRKTVNIFLNQLQHKTSARNRNNYRASLSSVFESMFDHDMVSSNFVKQIKKLKTESVRHRMYSQETQEDIFSFLKKEDPFMLLYIKFMAYSFMRPIEVCRLKVGDIDLNRKIVSFKPKNGSFKTKIIPDILLKELPDLLKMDKNTHLFTAEGIGKFTETKLESRRSYFTARFKKVVKERFELDLEHTMYSFRHTFITKLYREIRKTYAPFEAKSRLMHITGHNSMKALESYLREVDAELPEDYSAMLSTKKEKDGEYK